MFELVGDFSLFGCISLLMLEKSNDSCEGIREVFTFFRLVIRCYLCRFIVIRRGKSRVIEGFGGSFSLSIVDRLDYEWIFGFKGF